MGFLLTKILFLMALPPPAARCFAYWWFRRHYEDVTLDSRLARAKSGTPGAAVSRSAWPHSACRPICEPPRSSSPPVHAAVSDIDIPILERVDLSPLHARLEDLTRRVGDIRSPPGAGSRGPPKPA